VAEGREPDRAFLAAKTWGGDWTRLSVKNTAASIFDQQIPTTLCEVELHLDFQWAYKTQEPQLCLLSPGNMPHWGFLQVLWCQFEAGRFGLVLCFSLLLLV